MTSDHLLYDTCHEHHNATQNGLLIVHAHLKISKQIVGKCNTSGSRYKIFDRKTFMEGDKSNGKKDKDIYLVKLFISSTNYFTRNLI
jgi:hypothetical protein